VLGWEKRTKKYSNYLQMYVRALTEGARTMDEAMEDASEAEAAAGAGRSARAPNLWPHRCKNENK